MSNSNLEFRKIPSLQFLYEVNENGTVIRNVKSKKRLKSFKIKDEYFKKIKIKDKLFFISVKKIVEECWKKPKVNPVSLKDKNGTIKEFPTAKKAAKFLSTVYKDKTEKSFNDKFHLRRKRIFDYDVEYLNAETAYGNHNW